MLMLAASIAIAFLVLVIAEGVLGPKLGVRTEISRKLVHMAHGLAAASWPFFLTMQTIIVVELVFLAIVILARKLRIFRSIYDVDRITWGEVLFPLGVIAVALIHPNKWIFAAAMLHLGLADAIAAIVGTSKGKKHKYVVLGHTKTYEGTLAFWISSLIITIWVTLLAPSGLKDVALPLIIFLPLLATCIENIGVFGSDNILIPVVVTAVLMSL